MADFSLPQALILAGGAGRRMGAPAKPLVPLAGRPLIAHVLERIRPQTSGVWINANEAQDAYLTLGCEIVPDTTPNRPGPLAGVLAGLERLARTAPGECLLTVPADTPFLPPDLVSRLAARQRDTGTVVCAGSGGWRHPVVALWPAGVCAALRQSLGSGQLKVGLLLEALGAVTESWDTDPDDPFFNVNTPEELAIAEFRTTARQ